MERVDVVYGANLMLGEKSVLQFGELEKDESALLPRRTPEIRHFLVVT